MSESGPPSPAPDTKQSGGELASNDRARRTRTRSMVLIGMAIVGLFLILLVAGLVPRIRNQRELAGAAQRVQSALPQVYVVRPQPAAEANVESNRANVQRLQEMTSFQRILAPFNGTVIQRNVDVGALITAGSPVNNTAVAPSSVTGGASGLFEVAQIDTLRVFVNVPQVYAPTLKAGLPVEVAVRGQLMQPVTGTVTRTAGALDPGTRTPGSPAASGPCRALDGERDGRGLHGGTRLCAAIGGPTGALQVASGQRGGPAHLGRVVALLSRARARSPHRNRQRIEPDLAASGGPRGRGARACPRGGQLS